MFETTSTTEILARAIDVCALRQAVYSANVANANVDGYRRMEVLFDPQVLRAETANSKTGLNNMSVANTSINHQIVTTEQTVKLDEEMATLARNALRYETLLGIYERSASLLKTAIQEGKGG
jgi:flagellar basal-body rod protein FlgB